MVYPVELYDAIHRGTPGDVEFYRRVCHDADSVLELGCGTGRVLSQLDDDGRRLVGVDVNTEALARAREVAPSARLVAADMRELALGEKFARVIAPFNALYCLRDTAELARTLTRVAEHLEPGGTFAADVWTADEFHAEADPGDPEADELDFLVEVLTFQKIMENPGLRHRPQILLIPEILKDLSPAFKKLILSMARYLSLRFQGYISQ